MGASWASLGDLGVSLGPPQRLGKRSLQGTVCSVPKRDVDLHALRHKASADYNANRSDQKTSDVPYRRIARLGAGRNNMEKV